MPKPKLCRWNTAAKRTGAAEFVCRAATSETVSFHSARRMYRRVNARDTDFIKNVSVKLRKLVGNSESLKAGHFLCTNRQLGTC
jgi:hypothetical protein